MSRPLQKLQRFFRELKRRNVYKVAIGYLVAAFVALQAADLLVPETTLPSGTESVIVYLTIAGFPLALVIAWAFEVTPEGVRRTPVAGPAEEGASEADDGLSAAYKVLVALGLAAAAVAGGWYLTGGGGETPEISEGTVAVLPFEVSGSGADDWRDGMVTMLTPGLDGAGGLRAIPDRTVFAAWEGKAQAEEGASSEEALAVAREVGAEYAVVGSAVTLGSGLQLTANVRSTRSGDRLGRVEVRGSPDSVMTLADSLARRVLGVLAEQMDGGLRAADLASVTTTSDSALRAFLAGERHLRDWENEAAIRDFRAAIRADSSFALPYARIAVLGLWHGEFRGRYMERAYGLSDQLPERQRRLVRALHRGRIEGRMLAAADSLRQLTDDYPDDPRIWSSLGEFVAHEFIPRGLPEVERAHARAVALDSTNTSYYDHFILSAFTLGRDSATVAERVAAIPDAAARRILRLALQVVYGTDEARREALAAYDTVHVPKPSLALLPYRAEHFDLGYEVQQRLLRRDDLDEILYEQASVRALYEQGRVEEALNESRRMEPRDPPPFLVARMTLGDPIPDSILAEHLAPRNLPSDARVEDLVVSGLYLVETGRGGEIDGLLARIKEAPRAEGLHVSRELLMDELRGYRAFRSGDLRRAEELWAGTNPGGAVGALWRGDLYRQLGDLNRAEGWYQAAMAFSVTYERLGKLYEEMDKPEKAAVAYRRFVAAWADADKELQPRVEEARERLRQLTASEAEPDE